MDLIGQEESTEKNRDGKKLVMLSLIVSIIALILLVILIMVIISKPGTKQFKLYINDEEVAVDEATIITDEQGKRYMSLQKVAANGGFTYYRGEYLKHTEDPTYCYLENQYIIIGFETDSKTIYKTIPDSVIGYQYYELSSAIMNYEGVLYVALDDLQVACNLTVEQNEETSETTIYTLEFLAELYDTQFTEEEKNITVSSDYINRMAMAYDMTVISENGRIGVINSNGDTILGAKYRNIRFNEYNKTFITTALENNKLGVIDQKGNPVIQLEYDDLRVISYTPLLYEVKSNGRVGILDEKGNTVVNIEYDSLGYAGNSRDEKEAVLIIPLTENGEQEGIVVRKEDKYGIIDIRTGEVVIRP